MKRQKRKSVFEYTIKSLTIVDRVKYKEFEAEKKKCPNREERIFFHGTDISPSAKILTDMFKRSELSCQFGEGVYFTDLLDYAWYYGKRDEDINRANLNKIPGIDETFILVGSFIYYDKKKRSKQIV